MTVTKDDFNKIWASTSPLTPYSFSESHYKEGWNFIGSTPPSRQMWDFLQKQNDEKAQWLYLNVVQGIPIGVVQAFAGRTTPQGWLLCDGSAVSRTTYAKLFSVIGTTYGSGNGSTTFNLPNLVDKFVEGSATAGTVKSAGLPNITGNGVIVQVTDNSSDSQGLWVRGGNGALYAGGKWGRTGGLTNYAAHETYPSEICIDASRSNSIYGGSNTVQPPAVTMRYIIKY